MQTATTSDRPSPALCECFVDGAGDRFAPLGRRIVRDVEVDVGADDVLAAQVGDDHRDVRTAGVDADDGGGIRSQFESPRGPALAVVAGRAGVGEFAQDAALDQFVDHVDRRGAGETDRRHRLGGGECGRIPSEARDGGEIRLPQRGGRR